MNSTENLEKYIIKWSEDNQVRIIHGKVKAGSKINFSRSIYTLDSFLRVLISLNANVIVFECSLKNITMELIYSEVANIKNNLIRENILARLKEIEKELGNIYKAKVSSFIGNVLYTYKIYHPAYLEVVNILSEIDAEMNKEIDDEIDANSTIRTYKYDLTEEEKNKVANAMASNEEYYFIRYQPVRLQALYLEICEKLLSKEGVRYEVSYYSTTMLANKIFEKVFKEDFEKELNEKIQDLKKQGLSKISVKGKLKLTDTIINKFWYS